MCIYMYMYIHIYMQYDDVCWRGAAPDFEDIGDFFPSGEVAFGGAEVVVAVVECEAAVWHMVVYGGWEYLLGALLYLLTAAPVKNPQQQE